MAVAVDVTSTAVVTATGVTTYNATANITVGSGLSNGALTILVMWDVAATATTAHWDSAATNQLMTSIGAGTNSTGLGRVELFGLIAPTAGNKTLNLTWTGGSADVDIYAVSWTGVNQTGGVTSFAHVTTANNQSLGSAGVVTLNVTSATNNAVIAGFQNDFAWASPTPCNQTQLFLSNTAQMGTCANRAAGAASVSMTATNGATADNGCGVGCDIVAAAAGGAALPFNTYDFPKVWDIRQAPFDLSVQTNPNLFTNPFPFNQTDWTPARRIVRIPWPNELVDQVNNTRFKPLPSGVTFDTQSVGVITGSGATSFTDSLKMTVGTGLNRALIVELCLSGAPTGVSVTWNGVSLTQLASIADAGPNTTTLLFGLRNPASGTFALAGSWTGASSFVVSASAYINVNQASDAIAFQNANTATGAATPASVTVTSLANNLVVAAYSTTLTTFRNIGSIPLFASSIGSFAGAGNYALGAASVVMTASEISSQTWTAAGVSLNASPVVLPPDNWAKPLRVPKAPFDLSVLLNPNLFTGVIQRPFNQIDWSNTFRVPDWAPQPQTGINPNLFTNPYPFNQTDWSITERVPKAPFIPTDPLNINLFTNPIPFTQIDWSKPFRVPLALPQPSLPLNINLFTNPYPFNQYDWAKSVRIPQVPIDPSFQFNQNLTNFFPFNQTDWSKPFNVLHAPFDLSVPLNPNIFTNPYPFLNIDTSRPVRQRGLPQVDSPYNQTLYTVTISAVPFNQTYWPLPTKVSSAPVDFFNLVLYNIVSFPFNQIDWSKPFKVPQAPFDLSVSLNPNIFTNPIPVLATDRLPTKVPLPLPQLSPPLNINLFTNPYPILNINSVGVSPRRAAVLVDQTYNQSLYTVTVTAPFYAAEILPLRKPVSSPLSDPPLNINLFTNPYPILNIDSLRPVRQRGLLQVDAPYNQSLYTVTISAAPFNQTYWPLPIRVPSAPVDFYNLVLYNIVTLPFNQFDWSKPFTVPRASFDKSSAFNPNIFTNPIPVLATDRLPAFKVPLVLPQVDAPYNQSLYTVTVVVTTLRGPLIMRPYPLRPTPLDTNQAFNPNLSTNPIPLNQYDWRKPFGVPHAPFDLSVQTNLNLFKNEFPFNQYQYPTQHSVILGPPHVPPYNQNLYTATIGTTSHIVKFIGNVGHFMIR